MPRQHSRRRRRSLGGPLYSLITTLVVVICVSAALTMFFRVRNLEITGLHRYTEEQIQEAAGVEYGDNLFFMDKYAMKDEILRQLPYVESLRINRTYPDTLRIAVVECQHPMGIEQDGTVWLISAAGKIVDRIPAEAASGSTGETDAEGPDAETADNAEGETADSAPNTAAAESYGKITGCRLLAPAVGVRIALATENAFYQQSLLDLLAALEGTGMLEETDAIRMEDPAALCLDYAGRFTVKLRYDADFLWKLRTLEAYLASERIQDNMTGTFDMTKDDKNYFQQDVR
ncbi:MAG: FtsQ-type POTRA domain-containing protein, partial [Oscillibacter sp.]|nr:FtsQ-type POTRA domain-containing protein [Oscillibacter sp.]